MFKIVLYFIYELQHSPVELVYGFCHLLKSAEVKGMVFILELSPSFLMGLLLGIGDKKEGLKGKCSSCGALYTTDYCCSNGSLVDKIIYDLNKAPDSPHLYTFLSNQRHCFHCKDVLGDGELCQQCICTRCGSGLSKGLCLICKHNHNSLTDSPSISENSSQSPPHINHHCCYECGDPLEGIFCRQCTCKLCGNGAHYGYNCPPKVLIIRNPEPFNNQTIKEPPPTFPSFDSKSDLVHDYPNVFDPPPQLPFISYEFRGNDARYVTIVHLKFCLSIRNRVTIKTLISRQNFRSFMIFNNKIFVVKIAGLLMKLTNEEEKQIKEDQVANAQYWKIHACYDDDDDDYAFAITPTEPVNSLSMGDEHLDTILATESDEFINSSVENLVPISSKSEGESECDVPVCEAFTTFLNILFGVENDFYSSDDQLFYDQDVPKKIFSNPLFDEEIIPIKIDPHHFNAESDLIESLLNTDSSIILSSKIDSLFDEFAGELTLLKSISSGIDEIDCDLEEESHFIKRLLYDNSSPRPSEEFVSENSDTEIESFFPSHIPVEDSDSLMEEINLSFTLDYPMPPGIEEDGYDSERDFLILDELLSNDSLLLPEIESFYFDIPLFFRPPPKPPDGNTGILNVKMMGDISEQKVLMPKLMITLVPNQEKSPVLLSHLGHEAFQLSANCPMRIHGKNTPILDVPLFHFYPP
nr:hypothetical protein [Tanacetum cinerariifolium]